MKDTADLQGQREAVFQAAQDACNAHDAGDVLPHITLGERECM